MELMISVLVMGTMFAIALPAGKAALDSLELGNATREVERELQTARMRAVSANRPMRLNRISADSPDAVDASRAPSLTRCDPQDPQDTRNGSSDSRTARCTGPPQISWRGVRLAR